MYATFLSAAMHFVMSGGAGPKAERDMSVEMLKMERTQASSGSRPSCSSGASWKKDVKCAISVGVCQAWKTGSTSAVKTASKLESEVSQ